MSRELGAAPHTIASKGVQAYRTDQAIQRIWKTEASLLCCVGPALGATAVGVRGLPTNRHRMDGRVIETPDAVATAGRERI
jgi:hypothetical protein